MIERSNTGIENRRSERISLRVPIQVRWTPPGDAAITEESTTLVVNAHGALIQLAMKVKVGVRIHLRLRAGGDAKDCRVVRVEGKQNGKSEVGVEFLVPDGKFWQLESPPENWQKAGLAN